MLSLAIFAIVLGLSAAATRWGADSRDHADARYPQRPTIRH
jgi:hypothetical protein